MELLAVFLGVVLGWVGSFFHQTYYSINDQDVALLNDYISDLNDIEALASEYWLAEDDSKLLPNLAALLRGKYHAVCFFEADAPRLLSNDLAEYHRLDGLIFDTALGGTFETAHRTRSPEVAVSIMRGVREQRALLRRARRKRFWAR